MKLSQLKQIFKIFIAFLMAFTPIYTYGAKSDQRDVYKGKVYSTQNNSVQTEVENGYVEYKLNQNGDAEIDTYVNNKGKAVFENKTHKIIFEKAKNSELEKYSPEKLNKEFKIEWGKRAVETAKHFPAEAAIFYMAMGAVTFVQMMAEYENNPMAMQQMLEHSFSPSGLFGFYLFIYTSGITSDALIHKWGKLSRGLVGYLGMTAGMFAQSYFSSLVADPNASMCAKSMIGNKKYSVEEFEKVGADPLPCNKLFYEYVLGGKIYELMPSLISMLGATFLASLTQQVIRTPILKISGFDIASAMMPGKVQIKSIRWVLAKGLNISLFLAFDHLIIGSVNYLWRNSIDVSLLRWRYGNLNNSTVNSTVAKADEIKTFSEHMVRWRMSNLESAMTAYQSWNEYLSQLIAKYSATYEIYSDFIGEYERSKNSTSNSKLTNKNYLLWGVIPNRLREGGENLYISKPELIQRLQIEKIKESVTEFERLTTIDQNLKYFKAKFQNTDYSKIQNILNLLKSEDLKNKSVGLTQLNAYYEKRWRTNQNPFFEIAITQLYELIGKPNPKLEFGKGYFHTFTLVPEYKQLFDSIKYGNIKGNLKFENVADYLAYQMLCGPDLESNLISKNSMGFKSNFTPPRLIPSTNKATICDRFFGNINQPNIYTHKVKDNVSNFEYQSLVHYLIYNLDSRFKTKETFMKQWESETQSSFLSSLHSFQDDYLKITKKFKEMLLQSNTDKLNITMIPNNPIDSAQLEVQLYFRLLKYIFESSGKINSEEINSFMTSLDKLFLAYLNLLKSKLNKDSIKLKDLNATFEILQESLAPLEKVCSEINNTACTQIYKSLKTVLGEISMYPLMTQFMRTNISNSKIKDNKENESAEESETDEILGTGVLVNQIPK